MPQLGSYIKEIIIIIVMAGTELGISYLLLILLLAVPINSLILWLLAKWFKFSKQDFKYAFIIAIITSTANFLLELVNIPISIQIILFPLYYFIDVLLIKYVYSEKWSKTFLVALIWWIIGIVSGIITAFILIYFGFFQGLFGVDVTPHILVEATVSNIELDDVVCNPVCSKGFEDYITIKIDKILDVPNWVKKDLDVSNINTDKKYRILSYYARPTIIKWQPVDNKVVKKGVALLGYFNSTAKREGDYYVYQHRSGEIDYPKEVKLPGLKVGNKIRAKITYSINDKVFVDMEEYEII